MALSTSGRSLTKISISSPNRGFGPVAATDADDAPAVDEARGRRVACAAGVALPLGLLTGAAAAGVRLLLEEAPAVPVFLELMARGE
jgi:hypothetical protein